MTVSQFSETQRATDSTTCQSQASELEGCTVSAKNLDFSGHFLDESEASELKRVCGATFENDVTVY